ncbi:MAG: TonB-dependent receptor [Desulfuromonadaceae bacterium]|nr:TonB-dependent receptor [Desulfuromonadaceae bacterium]MDD2850212.1 TonB-dependent receptor [Desulfuromonadaceae bacterium]MDD4130718.1 TonB-dependent receptor [Desulfuromonadaceae bacterium]
MNIKPLHLLAVSFSMGLLCQSAYAESQILDEITVRGEKESPNEESLSIREVRESPAKDMGEALKMVDGLSSVRKGAIANDVVLRGFQRDNINVLVDGVRLHGACPSRMDPPSFHYDFAEIEQVKVIKGPYDLSNPGGLGGVIDAQTRKTGRGFGGDINLSYGEWNSINTSATASYGTETYDGLIGYAYKNSDVPKSGDGKRLTEIYPSTSVNRYKADAVDSKAYEINTGWGKLGFNPTANSRSEISYTYQDADHVLYPYLKMDADYDKTHRLNWTYRIRNISSLVKDLKLQAYWDTVDHLMDDSSRVSSTPSVNVTRPYSMQTDASTHVYGVKLNAAMGVGPGTLKTGIDYYNRNWDAVNRRAMYLAYSDYAMIPDVSIDNTGIFGEYELPLGNQLALKGGLRGDLTWVEAAGTNTLVTTAGKSRDFSTVSTNLQLTYTPVKGLDIFTGIARGARTPDQQELYLYLPGTPLWKGNPDLKPTINHQADLGAKFSTERFYVNASIFYSDLHDYVNFYQASPTLKSYQNIHATMWGGELGSQVSLAYDLFLRASLSYVRARNETADTPLSEIPPLKGYVSLRHDNGTYFLEALENFAKKQNRVDTGLSESTTPGWVATDIKGGVNYRDITLTVGINNLFNKQYFSHLSYARDPFQSGIKVPENGRNAYFSLGYKF